MQNVVIALLFVLAIAVLLLVCARYRRLGAAGAGGVAFGHARR